MLTIRGEKPNQFFSIQPVPHATSKVIWKKIVGGSVKFAKDEVTKQNIAGRDLKLAKRRKLKQQRKRERNSRIQKQLNLRETSTNVLIGFGLNTYI